MTLAGKHGIGIISIGSLSNEGLNALPTQWGFAETAAAKARQDGRSQKLARSVELAYRRDPRKGTRRSPAGTDAPSQRICRRHLAAAGATAFTDPDEAVDKTAFGDGAAATIGTPDDLVARIKSVLEVSGGSAPSFGFVHDWANPENTTRSWDMVARYVVPEINGYLRGLRQSQDFVSNNRGVFDRAKEAIMAKITENEAAVARARGDQGIAPGRRIGEQHTRSRQGPRAGGGAIRGDTRQFLPGRAARC